MTAETKLAMTFKLGRVVFEVENCQADFLEDLSRLLPHASAEESAAENVVGVKMGCSQSIRELVNHVLKRHRDCIWLDAACLVSPSGKKILFAGKSSSGKTTMAMALAMSYKWSLLAEDIVLLDPSNNEIICFPSPFSLKRGTMRVLRRAIGQAPEKIYQKEWTPSFQIASTNESHFAPFDVAIHLVLTGGVDEMKVEKASAAEFVRKVLPISNLARKPDGIANFMSLVEPAQCYELNNGSLEERLQFAHDICQEPFTSMAPSLIDSDDLDPIDEQEKGLRLAIREKDRYRRKPQVTTNLLPDGHCLLMSVSPEAGFTLTPAAAIIWELVDGDHSVSEIESELAQLPFAPNADISILLSETIQDFWRSGLIEAV